jgi:hypothetical protein
VTRRTRLLQSVCRPISRSEKGLKSSTTSRSSKEYISRFVPFVLIVFDVDPDRVLVVEVLLFERLVYAHRDPGLDLRLSHVPLEPVQTPRRVVLLHRHLNEQVLLVTSKVVPRVHGNDARPDLGVRGEGGGRRRHGGREDGEKRTKGVLRHGAGHGQVDVVPR